MAKAEIIDAMDWHGPAREGIAVVLKRRLDEMCSLRVRALDFNDPEGVHDMRVSSRRLRSALRDFAPYFKKGKLSGSVDQIKTLADVLGEVRDDDVAIVELTKIQAEAPPDRGPEIQKLIASIELKRLKARRKLVTLVTSRKLNALRRTFSETLPAAIAAPKRKKAAQEVTYSQMAAKVVANRVSELESLSTSLHNPLKTKRLHRMRISAKRLRYAVELFAPCFGERSVSISKQLATMQSSLGGLHDCDIWIEYFGNRLSNEKTGVDQHTDSQRDAMIWLLGHFTKQRAKYFRAALSQWREWEKRDLLGKLLSIHQEEAAVEVAPEPQTITSERGANRAQSAGAVQTQKASRPNRTKAVSPPKIEPAIGVNGPDEASVQAHKEIAPVKRDITLEKLQQGLESEPAIGSQTEDQDDNGAETHRVLRLGKASSNAGSNGMAE
jgi:CHAD domain-containing protein